MNKKEFLKWLKLYLEHKNVDISKAELFLLEIVVNSIDTEPYKIKIEPIKTTIQESTDKFLGG